MSGHIMEYASGREPRILVGFDAILARLSDLDRTSPLYAETINQLGKLSVEGYDITDPAMVQHARIEAERHRRLIDGITVNAVPGPSLVYYMRIRDTIKIGYTTQPVDDRRRQVLADEVLAVEPGSMKLERARHRQFAHLNIPDLGPERFTSAPDLLDHIAMLRSHYPDMQAGVAA